MADHVIDSVESLVAVLGEPHEFLKEKVYSELDGDMQAFIASSTLVMISTLDASGNPDVSPKGDPAGFVRVDGPDVLHIPDRPGNKLAFGFRNLLQNPSIGLLFITPNSRETLRVKGKATLSTDPALLQSMSVKGKPALLATTVQIEECFMHCGKAMIRSGVWQPESWPEKMKSVIARQASRMLEIDESLMESELEKNYQEELY